MQTWMHTSYTSWEPETYVFKQTLPLKGFGEPPDRPELAIDVGTEMGQLKRASHSQIQLYNGTRFKVSLLQWQEMTISIRIFARAKEKAPRKLLSSQFDNADLAESNSWASMLAFVLQNIAKN